MDIMERIRSLFTRHTELGRQHKELGKSLDDLKREAELVQDTVDKAILNFQDFAMRVKKSRATPVKAKPQQSRTKRTR